MNQISTEADSEDAFQLQHGGMTRAEWAEKVRPQLDGEGIEDLPTNDMSGEFPKHIIRRRGLSAQRAKLAQFHDWQMQEERKLTGLQALKAKMQAIIAKPGAAEAEIRREVKKAAAVLMGSDPGAGVDTANRKQLDDRLTSERHVGEAAREALSQIESNITVADVRLSGLNDREAEFMRPALIECAEELGLAKLYLKKIAELKQVAELVFGLHQIIRGPASIDCQPYGERQFRRAEAVSFPRDFPSSVSGAERDQVTIRSEGRAEIWKQLGVAILLNPDMDASKFIALPK